MACIELVTQLQRLFAYLINSNRKCVDTKAVTSAIVDDAGNLVKIGEQKDVGEFNINFLSRVNEALEMAAAKRSPPKPTQVEAGAQRELEKSVALGKSVFLPIAPEELSSSFIYKTFFGSSQILTKALDEDNRLIELKTDSTFGQIIVNAEAADIYKGWEMNYYGEIEDFKLSNVHCAKIIL